MTICNMSIEGGARAGMVAPDDTTFEYVAGRPHAPSGAAWDAAVARWRELPTDDGAAFDRSIAFDASELTPMVTSGTNPGMGFPITSTGSRTRSSLADASQRDSLRAALSYMALTPGEPILGRPIDVVFVGSLHELADQRPARGGAHAARAARRRWRAHDGRARLDRGEAPGRDRGPGRSVFREAGAEWREAGCSMCIAMNGDQLSPGQYSVSTSEPQLRGPPGEGRPHVPRFAADRGRIGRHRSPADPRALL